ncbi:MAG: twin-arginine translocase subunit TatC [Bdellovibrio sp.]|nr:twin-arginine translocase subunit TatC [Bdellovibrio sp.]
MLLLYFAVIINTLNMSTEPTLRNLSFIDHFDELRKRVVRCLSVFFIGFIVFYFFADHFLSILRKPLFDYLPPDQQKLYFTHLFENFLTHLKIGAVASLFFLSPYYFYDLWAFVSPCLYQKENKQALHFVLIATVFFLGGASFAYFVLFPVGFKYFITYGSATDVPLLTISSYYSMCIKLLLLFGVAFELPVLICLLGVLGIVDAKTLKTQRRTAIIFIAVISALFAPPDAVSMLILGGPLYLLYEIAIVIVDWQGRRK